MGPADDITRDTGTPATPGWDRSVYDTLAAVLGPAALRGLTERFRADLAGRFGEGSRDRLRKDAHAIVSAAGMLGFVGLSEAARRLEQACESDADLNAPRAALEMARVDAERCLAALPAAPAQLG